MSCKKCRHWFVNPNIVIPGEPTEGKCLVSEIKTQSNHVCNAWEHSQVADWKDENEKLTARIAELETEIDQLTAHDATERQDDKWIPVSERLPDNWESVLTIDISKSTQDVVSAFYNPETSLWSTPFSFDLWVTHWMPLPEPPIVYGKVCEE